MSSYQYIWRSLYRTFRTFTIIHNLSAQLRIWFVRW